MIATIVLVLVIGVLRPTFLNPGQLLDVLNNSVYVALLAAGMAFLLAMREIDLSVGATFGLTLIVTALLIRSGVNSWLAMVVGIGLGAVLGLVNAMVVRYIAIPAFVATLATMQVFRGLAVALGDGQQVNGLPLDDPFFVVLGGDFLGLPVSVWILILVTAGLTALLRWTPFGYRVRSIGSNPDAAAFSGISIANTRTLVLVLVGAVGGLAGVLGLAFFTSGDPNIGLGFELQAIAAAVIGGTPLRGGVATVVGAVFGAILLGVVDSGLVYFNIPANWSAFTTGLVVLLAVGVDSALRSRRRARESAFGL
ncbi:ribose ABC transporter permease [Saccharothrix violaceirubra]|uniref:Ribose transport system permease protein n=1 Tax=Saccharothrix violaceirubra TaxID=413306 RepID=A0A7W7T3Q7_9PSEU|nr:ABC transporter permease [Saccharothrix violaceirubra]MBB4965741.1 ribose transport system permease protein [Saccharothrix violaceirubra]